MKKMQLGKLLRWQGLNIGQGAPSNSLNRS